MARRLIAQTALVACALAVSARAWALDNPAIVTFSNGPLAGMSMSMSADRSTAYHLRPSPRNAARLPDNLQPAVTRFIRGIERRRALEFFRQALSEGATSTACETSMASECTAAVPFYGSAFREDCEANTPYFLGDGSRHGSVRIEWMYHGRVYYLTYLTFRDDKIASVTTTRATVPPFAQAIPASD